MEFGFVKLTPLGSEFAFHHWISDGSDYIYNLLTTSLHYK